MATIQLAARAYQQSFDARPYTTLAITNGSLSAIGDAVAQAVQMKMAEPGEHEDAPRFDIQRTLRFFTFGFAMGPLIGRWNKFLEARFPLRPPNATFTYAPMSSGVPIGSRSPPFPLVSPIGTPSPVSGLAVAKRVASDQLFMAPIGLFLFIGSMGLMEGQDSAHIARKYRDLYPDALRANWQVWPLAQVVNFRYMALPARVPFQATCGVFWTLYLSLLNARGIRETETDDVLRRTADN